MAKGARWNAADRRAAAAGVAVLRRPKPAPATPPPPPPGRLWRFFHRLATWLGT
jgi:hypothetical protein